MEDLLHIALTATGSVAALFLLTKWMGNRQLSQMSMFDYINGITIGSIAAEMATSLAGDFLKPLAAMAVYALAGVAISMGSCKFMAVRRFFNGRPIVLYENGRLYEKNLAVARLDINEFLTQCRVGGYFDLSQLQSAILETNGQISFLPLPAARPLTPGDLGLEPAPERIAVCVIIDGEILADNLKFTGNDEVWLQKKLAAQHVRQSEVFLALCSAQNELTVYQKTGSRMRREMFE